VSRISQDGGGKQKAEHNEKKGYTPEDKKKQRKDKQKELKLELEEKPKWKSKHKAILCVFKMRQLTETTKARDDAS